MHTILTVNTGSSSIKLGLYARDTNERLLSFTAHQSDDDYVNIDAGGDASGVSTRRIPIQNYSVQTILETCIDYILQNSTLYEIAAIGHRIVQSPPESNTHEILTEHLIRSLQAISKYDLIHMSPALIAIEKLQALIPTATHVACYDTAFFHEIPKIANTIAVPQAHNDVWLRRHGFHGLSYEYIMKDFQQHEGSVAASGKVVVAHLGSGSSITALVEGKPVDTSMGFFPNSGLVTSTRSGDIEPAVYMYLCEHYGLSISEVYELLEKSSGLLAISGYSGDMKTLLADEKHNERASLATSIYCYQIQKTIGAYAAAMNGVNSIIFSGGIGEQSADIRARICAKLSYLGVHIDTNRNTDNQRLISADSSAVGVHCIPTNESRSIQQITKELIERMSQ